jgi:uncharacterized protein
MTLTTLPLFPLSTILFPDGLLPLQIFELRYLTMIKQCIAAGTEFGVVSETAQAAEPMSQETFTSVGTSAKIVTHSAPQPGLLRIDCVGSKRFTVVSCEQQKLGLWVAQVNFMEIDQAIPVPEELLDTVTALRHVVTSLTRQASNANHVPIAQPYQFDDCGWVANRWCELISMQPEQRYRLLTLENPLIRLELVQDLLDTGGFLR